MGLTKSANFALANSESLTRADETNLDITGNLTIEAWIRLASTSTTRTIAAKWGDSISWDRGAYGFRFTSNTLNLILAGSGTSTPSVYAVSVAWTPSTGVWYHVAVVYTASAGSAKFYVDGEQQGSTQTGLDTKINNVSLPFTIGANHNGSDQPYNFFDGDISLLRLWAEARTTAQIADNLCNVLGATTNLRGEWTLDDIVTDNSGNGQTLTNNNTVTFTTDLPTVCASTSVTVNATVLAATFSIISAVISGTANVVSTVLSAVFSTQAPEISAGATADAGVFTATFSIPTVNVITPDAQVDVGVLSATFSIPSPTPSGASNVDVNVQTATFSIPAIAFIGDVSVAPSAQSATFSTPVPTISAIGNVSVAASVLEATFSIASPTVTAEQNAMVSAGVLVATFTTPAPTITAVRNVELTATVVSATFSVARPRKMGGVWSAQPRVNGDAAWTPQPRAI